MEMQSNGSMEQNVKKQSGLFGAANFLFDFVETFAIAVFAVLLLFTFFFRLCKVDGNSMQNTLYDGQQLIVWSAGYTPTQGDIVVCDLSNNNSSKNPLKKTIVKRVIATEGQEVKIDFNESKVYVDGVLFDHPDAVLKDRITNEITGVLNPPDKSNLINYAPYYDEESRIYVATVPKGCVFVMGDNRNNSNDSRSNQVGFVDARCVLGKAILRLPFTVLN